MSLLILHNIWSHLDLGYGWLKFTGFEDTLPELCSLISAVPSTVGHLLIERLESGWQGLSIYVMYSVVGHCLWGHERLFFTMLHVTYLLSSLQARLKRKYIPEQIGWVSSSWAVRATLHPQTQSHMKPDMGMWVKCGDQSECLAHWIWFYLETKIVYQLLSANFRHCFSKTKELCFTDLCVINEKALLLLFSRYS